jgi:hypothetical protein
MIDHASHVRTKYSSRRHLHLRGSNDTNETTNDQPIVITKKVSHIKAVWKSNYGITEPVLDLEFDIIKPDEDAIAQETKTLLDQGLQQRQSDDDDSEMDRKMSPVDYNQPVDDSSSLNSSNSNLDDTVTNSERGNTIHTTVFNPR